MSDAKKYKISYPVVAAVVAVLCFFGLTLFELCSDFLYACFYTISVTSAALLVTRIILHCSDNDNSLKTWQVHIYFAFASAGWTFACTADTWLWSSVWLCVVFCGIVLALGTRYLNDVNNDGIADIFQDKTKIYTKEFCVNNLLFKFKDDKLGAKPDDTRPLCLDTAGNPITVAKARLLGLDDQVISGMAYIDTFFVNS